MTCKSYRGDLPETAAVSSCLVWLTKSKPPAATYRWVFQPPNTSLERARTGESTPWCAKKGVFSQPPSCSTLRTSLRLTGN